MGRGYPVADEPYSHWRTDDKKQNRFHILLLSPADAWKEKEGAGGGLTRGQFPGKIVMRPLRYFSYLHRRWCWEGWFCSAKKLAGLSRYSN